MGLLSRESMLLLAVVTSPLRRAAVALLLTPDVAWLLTPPATYAGGDCNTGAAGPWDVQDESIHGVIRRVVRDNIFK